MIIHAVELEDVKSYGRASIPLRAGVNAIVGQNGAGKSSVLEAIGYALFDFMPYRRQSDFVRAGLEQGAVLVECEDEAGSFSVRRVAGNSTWIIESDGGPVASGRNEAVRWLLGRYGLPQDYDLTALFTGVVGVPQGSLVAPFLEPAGQRRERFDRLLRVSEYKKARERLAGPAKEFGLSVAALQARVDVLAGLAGQVPQLSEQLAELQADKAAKWAAVQEAAQVEAVAAKLAQDVEKALDAKNELVSGIQLAEQAAHSSSMVYNAALRAETIAFDAEELLALLGPIEADYQQARVDLEALESKAGQRDADMAAMGRLVVQYRYAEQAVKQLRDEVAQTEKALAGARALAESRAAESGDHPDWGVVAYDTAMQVKADELTTADRALGAAKAALHEAEDAYAALANGQCPFLYVHCEQCVDGIDAKAVLQTRVAGMRAQAETCLDQVHGLMAYITMLRGQREARIRLLVAREQAGVLEANYTTAAAKLADAEAAFSRAQTETDAHAAMMEQWQVYDAQLAGMRGKIVELEPTHTQYVQAATIWGTPADRLDRQAERERLGAAVVEAEQKVNGLQAELAWLERERAAELAGEAQAQKALNEAKEAFEVARDAMAEASEKVSGVTARLTDAKGQEAECKLAETQLADTGRAHELLDFTRRVYGTVGPVVVEKMLERISAGAAEYYAEITATPARLDLRNDYEIVLADLDGERGLWQLSGGERMAAALAVNLAMLREVSNIGMVFLDEPTTNMDAMRRGLLAEQVGRLVGLDQLVIISHDDTFEAAVQHVVRVEKAGGLSRVSCGICA